jgi:D-beta-D-heptose 7-phosphate kinase/D-beta-D-heptose 1-phosphate adenosyltransferase
MNRTQNAVTAGLSKGSDDEQLIRLLGNWQQAKLVVIGDYMLDRYVYGNADRLSPDAPVPVLTVQRDETQPGGAANVCLDLIALQCKVACLGLVGNDPAGRQLRVALKAAGCDTTGLIATSERPTTLKHNFVGLAQHRHPQKMFRVDEESQKPIPRQLMRKLLTQARRLLKGAAALCIEDLNKGVITHELCQELIDLARKRGVPVLVDPALVDDYRKYRGATCIAPNRTEASLAMGIDFRNTENIDVLEQMAHKLLVTLKLDAVVLTLDKNGLLLLEKRRKVKRVPTKTRAVYDVTGAGDMVLAMLGAALANRASWLQAVKLANMAAGLEVEKFGVVPIHLNEVLWSLLSTRQRDLGKFRELEQLLPELAAYRVQDKRITFTNGCFDLLHAGHIGFLRAARRAGDVLVVGLNSDTSIQRIKGNGRPLNSLKDRVTVLSELESVDYIVVFDEDTPLRLIKAIRPDVLAKGADYSKSQVVGSQIVESYGGRIKLVKLTKGRSTTKIIRKIKKRVASSE